jgi:hypothetical protein
MDQRPYVDGQLIVCQKMRLIVESDRDKATQLFDSTDLEVEMYLQEEAFSLYSLNSVRCSLRHSGLMIHTSMDSSLFFESEFWEQQKHKLLATTRLPEQNLMRTMDNNDIAMTLEGIAVFLKWALQLPSLSLTPLDFFPTGSLLFLPNVDPCEHMLAYKDEPVVVRYLQIEHKLLACYVFCQGAHRNYFSVSRLFEQLYKRYFGLTFFDHLSYHFRMMHDPKIREFLSKIQDMELRPIPLHQDLALPKEMVKPLIDHMIGGLYDNKVVYLAFYPESHLDDRSDSSDSSCETLVGEEPTLSSLHRDEPCQTPSTQPFEFSILNDTSIGLDDALPKESTPTASEVLDTLLRRWEGHIDLLFEKHHQDEVHSLYALACVLQSKQTDQNKLNQLTHLVKDRMVVFEQAKLVGWKQVHVHQLTRKLIGLGIDPHEARQQALATLDGT